MTAPVRAHRLGRNRSQRRVVGWAAEVRDNDCLAIPEASRALQRGERADAGRTHHHECDDGQREAADRDAAAEPGPTPRDVRAGLERQRRHRALRADRTAATRRPLRCGRIGAVHRLLHVPVPRMAGSPASITPTAPGNVQSGSPMTSRAAQAVSDTSVVAAAQRPSACPSRMRPPARMLGAAAAAPLEVIVSRTRVRSLAACGRASGSFSRHCITNAASASGQSGRSERTSSGRSPRCAANSLAGESPWNGGRPDSSSYAIVPNEYRSARASVLGSPAACSGDM